jgi:GNAT superfamily N-acetyltransferase
MSYAVRRAGPDDAERIALIMGQAWPGLGDVQHWLTWFGKGNGAAWLLEDHTGPLAACTGEHLDTEDGGRKVRELNVGLPDFELSYLAVDTNRQRDHLGSRIEAEIIRELRTGGHKLLALDVESNRPGAHLFWKRLGWIDDHEELNPNGIRFRHVMSKRIDDRNS